MFTFDIAVTTTGSAGAAVGNTIGDTNFRGYIYKIVLDFHASAPSTTDTTITSVDADGVLIDTILTLTDVNTDAPYSPTLNTHDNVGVVRSGAFLLPNVPNGRIKIALAGCDALTDAIVATVHYLPVGSFQSRGV